VTYKHAAPRSVVSEAYTRALFRALAADNSTVSNEELAITPLGVLNEVEYCSLSPKRMVRFQTGRPLLHTAAYRMPIHPPAKPLGRKLCLFQTLVLAYVAVR
jgi:hypothetical protein